jgi:hypothetical protein
MPCSMLQSPAHSQPTVRRTCAMNVSAFTLQHLGPQSVHDLQHPFAGVCDPDHRHGVYHDRADVLSAGSRGPPLVVALFPVWRLHRWLPVFAFSFTDMRWHSSRQTANKRSSPAPTLPRTDPARRHLCVWVLLLLLPVQERHERLHADVFLFRCAFRRLAFLLRSVCEWTSDSTNDSSFV